MVTPDSPNGGELVGDLADEGGIDACHRLVEQNHLGIREQYSADFQQLLLTSGQVGDEIVEHMIET